MQVILYLEHAGAEPSLQKLLTQWGAIPHVVTTQAQLLASAMSSEVTAVLIVQSALEGLAAFRVLGEAGCTTPCILITHQESHTTRQVALHEGASAYFIAPFSYTELLRSISQSKRQAKPASLLRLGSLVLDPTSRTAYSHQTPLVISRREFDLLLLFMTHQGRVLTRAHIWEELWGFQDYPLANTIDVQVNRLRRKLPFEYRNYISTIYGVGYRFSSML